MFLTHLSLTDFRAFARLDMDVPRRILLLTGNNAQGKSSLLEAIYFLATFSSFQASHDRQLIHFQSANNDLSVARLVADYQSGGQDHHLEVRLIQERGVNGTGSRVRKEYLVDGTRRSTNEAIGQLNAVIFLPQMMRIIEGGPEDRRRYLNLALSQTVRGYGQVLSDYAQVLSQRNALLKLLNERGGDPQQMDYWDELLARKAAVIIRQRALVIEEIEILASRVHRQLSHGSEILRLVYQPSFDPMQNNTSQYELPIQASVRRSSLTEKEIFEAFIKRLNENHREEIARGVTIQGPHRDEVRFMGNGIDLGDYGSRGQIRSAVLSLKLAEVAWMKERTGNWPILLLDETLAELDLNRREDLLSTLGDSEQVIMTTTDLNLFPKEFLRNCNQWRVEQGMVNPDSSTA